MSKTVEILRKARALIKGGWCKESPTKPAKPKKNGWPRRQKTRYCATGAIAQANQIDVKAVSNTAAYAHLQRATGGVIPEYFNDDPWTTKRKMLKAFGRAIAAAEKADD
ncbi:MAG: DUF6197 family protein [Geminicoccaceae bacterium]